MKENQQIIIDLQTVRDVCQRSIESRKQMNIIIIQKLERERERGGGIFLFFFQLIGGEDSGGRGLLGGGTWRGRGLRVGGRIGGVV